MNKRILILLTVIMFAFSVNAKIKLGVKGAINVTDLSLSNVGDNFKASNRVGFALGPIIDFKMPIFGLGMDVATLFSYKTAELKSKDQSKNINEAGIAIPINLKYTFGFSKILGFYLAAGPDFFFNMSGSKRFENVKFKQENMRVGINVGGGFRVLNHLQIGATYNFPLSKSAKGNNDTNYSYKSKSWEISAAYFF